MIRYVRLVSGVELVGEQVSCDRNILILKNPLALEVIQRDGHAICTLVTYCVATSDLELNWRYILQSGEADPAFAETYVRRQEAGTKAPFYQESMEADDPDLMSDESVLEAFKVTYH